MLASSNPQLAEVPVLAPHSFDVDTYLTSRAQADTFVMVEFGHDALPVAYQQSRAFKDSRAYIGFEAWLRDPEGRKKNAVQKTLEIYGPTANIHFQTLALGGMVRRFEGDKWYDGGYDPTTPLPDGTVEEVLLGNILGDPYIAYSYERTSAMLSEAARIVSDSGVIVIRETISPDRVGPAFEKAVTTHKLKILAQVPYQDEQWDALENQFVADPHCSPNSYYLLLAK